LSERHETQRRSAAGLAGGKVKCHILLVSYGPTESPQTWSGTPRNLVRALREAGAEVSCFDASTASRTLKLFSLCISILTTGSRDFRRLGFYRRRQALALQKRIERSACDAVLSTTMACLPLVRTPSVPLMLYLDLTQKLRIQAGSGKPQTALATRQMIQLDQQAYEQSSHLFCISQYARQSLIDDYGIAESRTSAIGTGSGMPPLSLEALDGKDYGKRSLLFISKIDGGWHTKGGPLLLEALRLLDERGVPYHLHCIGHDEHRRYTAGRRNVTAHGFVDLDTLKRLLLDATLLVMPAEQEPWGLVYIEAMRAGIPPVGLRKAAFPEIVADGEYGFIIDEAAARDLAVLLEHLLMRPNKVQEIGINAREYSANKFTWSAVSHQILKTHKSIISAHFCAESNSSANVAVGSDSDRSSASGEIECGR
jgi:glycosyltransferase involved in cell wall biosynthesis